MQCLNRLASVSTLVVVAVLIPSIVAAQEVVENACAVIARNDDGSLSSTQLDDLRVLEQTTKDGGFVLPASAPPGVEAIMCGRSSIVPALGDYKILLAGFPLFIADDKDRV